MKPRCHIQRKANERNALLDEIARLRLAARSITEPIADFKSLTGLVPRVK